MFSFFLFLWVNFIHFFIKNYGTLHELSIIILLGVSQLLLRRVQSIMFFKKNIRRQIHLNKYSHLKLNFERT